MSPPLHDALLELFRHQPLLALELLTRLAVSVPAHHEVRVEAGSLTEMQPPEYRADLVLSLRGDKPALGIIVEAQLQRDTAKRYAWPLYVAGLRARLRCPVVLCVVTPKRSIARWAATPIRLGGGNVYEATVIGPAAIPAITDAARARELPELAVLSAIAHGKTLDHERAARIADAALQASLQLERARHVLYADIVLSSLSESARKLLQAMDPCQYELQSEIVKRWVALGRAKGEASCEASLLLKLLATKFGNIPAGVVERVRSAEPADVERWAGRLLSARTLEAVFS